MIELLCQINFSTSFCPPPAVEIWFVVDILWFIMLSLRCEAKFSSPELSIALRDASGFELILRRGKLSDTIIYIYQPFRLKNVYRVILWALPIALIFNAFSVLL